VLRNQGVLHAPDGLRMSKSKGNVVTPDSVVERYGADTLRVYLCFMAPFEDDVVWSDRDITGAHRFLLKLWRLALKDPLAIDVKPEELAAAAGAELALVKLAHRTVKQVTGEFERLHFNTAVARLMELLNEMGSHLEGHGRTPALRFALGRLVTCLAPIAPHVTEEIWQSCGGAGSVHRQRWPGWDEALAAEDLIEIPVQVNGKLRDRFQASRTVTEAEALAAARAIPKIAAELGGKQVVKAIFVPGRLVNFVVK
jgi:leucyl-tRNA synthetase